MQKIYSILLTFVLIIVSACSDNKSNDTWIVGISPDNPPYEFIKNGEIVGFDVDLINEIAKHSGKKVEIKNMELHSLLAALSGKNVDLVISGLSVTEERLKKVDFSIPYSSTSMSLLYRQGDQIHTLYDLKNKIIGAQLGSTWNIFAHELAPKYEFTVSSLSSNLMLVEELNIKRIDGVILETVQSEKFIEIYPHLTLMQLDSGQNFAIAMPKNSAHKKEIDHAIKALKANGSIGILSKKWGLVGQ